MDDLTIKAPGADIYREKAHYLTDVFIRDELDGNTEKLETSAVSFQALLRFIRANVTINRDDIDELDHWFNTYLYLCSRFEKIPTLAGFAIVLGADPATLSDWAAGKYRDNAYSQAVKRWKRICGGSLIDVMTQSPGSSVNRIFIAKACYGYSDQPVNDPRDGKPIPIVTRSREEIIRELGGDTISLLGADDE